MKLRLISDLHTSINRDYPLELDPKGVFTLIAGDMGPDYRKNAEWIRHNVIEGAFISGNHDAYTHDKTPLEDVKEFYHREFPLDSPITYFDNDVGVISKEIGPKLLLVADVLYTDYRLRVSDSQKGKKIKDVVSSNMFLASPKMSGGYMNDFNFFTRKGTYERKEWELNDFYVPKGCYFLRPQNYLDHFNAAFKRITEIVEGNPDKDIVLMTHHCLSKKCIHSEYSTDLLNASYVSNKDTWIKKHPNIKLILSGHVHHRNSFHVGETLYVLNPLGYIRNSQHKQYNPKTRKYIHWSPNCFVDTETWEMTYEPYENEGWEDTRKKYSETLLKYSGLFC